MHSPEDVPLAAGTVIDGRYRVIAELGAGGMGRVYEAEHMFIRRPMALKLLRRSAAGAEAAARMIQEATLAGQVPHPAVVRVFDCAALADGQVYVAMELLRGETLEQALARSIDAASALAVLAEVARGLAAVHRVGVVHRDIKPANIFLARGGEGVQAKLLDFGVAKALPGASELAAGAVRTQAGEVLGTPFYVAPEQIRGGAIDGRADLYGLGVILYEVLVGELPFVGDSYVAILGQHVRTPPLDPRQAAPGRGIPDAAARLAMQLLAKEPGERVADGDALAEAIAAVLASEGEALRGLTTGRGPMGEPGTVRLAAVASAGTMQYAEASGSSTVQLASVAGASVAGASTVRLAEGAGSSGATMRRADGSVAGASTVRLADAGDSVRASAELGGRSMGLAEGTGGDGTGLTEGTGGRGRWLVVGAVGAVAALGLWIAVRAPEAAPAPGVVPVGEAAAAPVPRVDPPPAPVAPVKVEAQPVTPATDPPPVAPATDPPSVPSRPPTKTRKTVRDGGTNRPPTKAPTKVGGDPPLKPDVYGDD